VRAFAYHFALTSPPCRFVPKTPSGKNLLAREAFSFEIVG